MVLDESINKEPSVLKMAFIFSFFLCCCEISSYIPLLNVHQTFTGFCSQNLFWKETYQLVKIVWWNQVYVYTQAVVLQLFVMKNNVLWLDLSFFNCRHGWLYSYWSMTDLLREKIENLNLTTENFFFINLCLLTTIQLIFWVIVIDGKETEICIQAKN